MRSVGGSLQGVVGWTYWIISRLSEFPPPYLIAFLSPPSSPLSSSPSLLSFSPLQHSPRADHFTCFARVEHGSRLVAESGRVEGEGGEELALNLEASIQCDPQSLDEIAQNPLLGELYNP